MDKQVLAYISERNLIRKDKKVLVAVSGGPDSMALLHFLWSHQEEFAMTLCVVTVDHCLRGDESKEDALYVQKRCELWNIPCIRKEVDVHQYKYANKVGTQLAARTLRYNIFEEEMDKGDYDYLAFGHHADDQIETVLMAVSRTTTLHNLTGIPVERPFGKGKIIRPLLSVGKKEIERYCECHQLQPRMDASNFTKDYSRNRLRADVVPYLKKENPNLITTMLKLTDTLREDEQYLTETALSVFQEVVQVDSNDRKLSVHINKLKTYPVSLQRRVFRLTLDYLYVSVPKQLSYTHEEILLNLLYDEGNKQLHFPRQLMVERAYHYIYFFIRHDADSEDYSYTIEDLPCEIILPNGATISFKLVEGKEIEENNSDLHTYICSKEVTPFPLCIRPKQAGDRMTYDGLTGTKKVTRIFIDEKIPRHERGVIPILVDGEGEILWIVGHKSNSKKLQSQSHYVCIQYTEE